MQRHTIRRRMRKISTSLLVSLGWEKNTRIQVSRSGLKFNLRPMGPSRKIYSLLVLCVAKKCRRKGTWFCASI